MARGASCFSILACVEGRRRWNFEFVNGYTSRAWLVAMRSSHVVILHYVILYYYMLLYFTIVGVLSFYLHVIID